MGEHLRPPFSGKIYITDSRGKEVEFSADFISEINVSQEVETTSIQHFENAMRTVACATKKLTLSLTAVGEIFAKFTGEEKEETPLSDNAWETMILNGIRNNDK